MKVFYTIVVSILLSNAVFAADYNYIDPGDYYYINGFGDDNEYVVVVRKMDSNQVKVRNLDTGATQIVSASRLLTKSELESVEFNNAATATVVGGAILYCLFGDC